MSSDNFSLNIDGFVDDSGMSFSPWSVQTVMRGWCYASGLRGGLLGVGIVNRRKIDIVP